uniref:DUF3309 domain-containing protein n=2 Tax=root TaxID=1 RepID=E6PST4_9ZZZZ
MRQWREVSRKWVEQKNINSRIRNRLDKQHTHRESDMSLISLLLIVLVIMFISTIPTWPHSRSWGYYPSGTLGFIVLILVVLLVLGLV